MRRIILVIKKGVQGFTNQLQKEETAPEDREGDPDWKMVTNINLSKCL